MPLSGAAGRLLLLVLAVVTVVTGEAGEGFVTHTQPLAVPMGGAVYLSREHLHVAALPRHQQCRVEVVMADPITQRVGHVQPPIFDCHFKPRTVQYLHNGCPLLERDEVKVRVHRFSSSETVTQTVYLRVSVLNASLSVVDVRGLRPLVVPEFHALSNAIDASALRFRRSGRPNVTCTVSFSRLYSAWPLVGRVVMGERRQALDSLKKSCRELLLMGLHYQHLRSPTPRLDYLPLSVTLLDPAQPQHPVSERYFLPIHIKGALPNSPPHASFINMYMMDVDQFVLTTIVPGVISAEDYETPKAQLVFNVSQPFRAERGHLVHLDHPAQPLTSFLQGDLDNHKVAYRPPSTARKDQQVHELELRVFDSHGASSVPLSLHVAVRPSSTRAPRVAHMAGLVLLEGQARPLTPRHLQVVDSDSGGRVRLYVKGGLQHGRLLVGGRPAMIFSLSDLDSGSVVYQHDDSDSSRDRLELRISDGTHTVLATFPITVIPKDDTPPYLITNLGLQLQQGGLKAFSPDLLLAHDADSMDSNILYTVRQSPAAGSLLMKMRPSDSATKIFGFTQKDLLKGQIYYQHDGSAALKDSFQFTLQDQQDPPNESAVLTFHILIIPINENPPELAAEATNSMNVPETQIGYISQSELLYEDAESESSELLYTVTTPPYFVYNRGERDAGRLVTTHNITALDRASSFPVAVRFTQADINHMKVAYIPPQQDIGPEPRLVRFAYTIEDSSHNKLYGQTFDIEVQPVNNQVPRFETSKLLVEEGGRLSISLPQLSASDVDTASQDLSFVLDALPSFGTLQKEGRRLRRGATFNLNDLRDNHIRYMHDGSDVALDTFTLALTDGLNQETKVISIHIVPIDDQSPQLSHDLRPLLIVSEGDEVTITSRILSATDEDTEDGSLVFLVVKQPRLGVLQLRGQPATKVTQRQVRQGLVTYLHTSGEIGTSARRDTVSFLVSDQTYLASSGMPVYDLNITITPVNNRAPEISLGSPILVAEGESFRFSQEVLSVSDADSKTKAIVFMITRQPQWGYIENTKPSAGSEKSNAGKRANSFTFNDVLDGSVNYVQANHRGVEPLSDELELFASDGKLQSPPTTITVTIVPSNDEAPDLMLKNFTVTEGGDAVIDQSMVDAIDLDMPKQPLKFTFSQMPQHGKMVMIVHTKKGERETEVTDFSLDELHSGLKLKYKHDGSENAGDKFAVTVSDGKHDIKKVCSVTVQLANDEKPRVLRNAGLDLDYGGSAFISPAALEAADSDNHNDNVFFIVRELPSRGLLQYCPDPFSPTLHLDCTDIKSGENFTQQDVEGNRVRYLHTSRLGASSRDQFLFSLSDGLHVRRQQTFWLRVKASGRAHIALLNRGMTVREGERVAISTFNLSASDQSTKAEEIVFAIIKPPSLGQLEFIDRRFTAIRSFSQMDIAAQKVVYHHLTKNDITQDLFTFTVTNGLSQAKDGEFRITIVAMDTVPPSLVINSLIEVVQGGQVTISPYYLKAVDPDTASHNLTFTVAKPPALGRLYGRGGARLSSFTQLQVELGQVRYHSDGSAAGLDNFLLTLSDGRHEGFLLNGTLRAQPAMASVFIKPLMEDAPTLVNIQSPDSLEYLGGRRYGFRLNSRVLRAVDSDADSSHLTYVIVQRPRHGHIENTVAKRYVRRRFTQLNLDDDSLLFVIDPKTSATNDTFTFRVQDQRANTLGDQRFDLSWSRVEFDRKELVACENVGRLAVTLLRHGNLHSSAYVSIQVREISANIGEDFIPSSAKQVQFDPGESRVTWEVMIRDEGLEEKNEKLRLTLRDPVNTIIGEQRKMGLKIIDAHEGHCPQFLGMVSKFSVEQTLHAPDPLPLDTQLSTPLRGHQLSGPVFLNTQAEAKAEDVDLFQQPSPPRHAAQPGSRRAKKGRKGKRGRNKKLKNGRNKHRKQALKQPSPSKTPTNSQSERQIPTTPAKYQPPQKCSTLTKGLLHFDDFHYQLLRCDGNFWQPWSPNSNNDEQAPASTGLCQQGWHEFEKRCYFFLGERQSWEEAESTCIITYGAHLTSVRSMRHLRWLGHISGNKSFWIGLNEKRQRGHWEFSNGEGVVVNNWKSGSPRVRRRRHKKNCALVKKNLKWRNKRCNKYRSRSVCEVMALPLPGPSPDTTTSGDQRHHPADSNAHKRRTTGSKRRARRKRIQYKL